MGKKMDLNSFKNNQKCFCSSGSVASATSSSSRSSTGIPDKQGLRTVHLKRQRGIYLEPNGKLGDKLFPNVKPNFGFSFRGGKEFGTGFFISVVEKDSEAQYKGLKVGDQIVRINGLSVEGATHQEVLQLAQSQHQLTLTLKSVGMIPVKEKNNDTITWKIVNTRADAAVGCDVDRIFILVPDNTHLGCGICKGPEWRPGIFVQYTKPNSLARKCGLQPGDQILQCNKISFLQIDFTYAVSVLKNSRSLDLVLKKGSGVDLFPGESSGYSSSSSVADETVTQSPSKSERLSMVAEGGNERNKKKSCQCKAIRTTLKPSGSIDSILDNLTMESSDSFSIHREKSKSVEYLTNSSAKKSVTFHKNVSKNFLSVTNPQESCHCLEGSQTVIKIESKDSKKLEGQPGSMPGEKSLAKDITSVEVCRSDSDKFQVSKSSSFSSYSSSCSLSSAISQEIQKRNERKLKGTSFSTKSERVKIIKSPDRPQRQQHDLLIAELKKTQKFDSRAKQIQFDFKSHGKVRQRTPKAEAEEKLPPSPRLLIHEGLTESPPTCPTPDYFSDASVTDQSIETSHTVKTSILKFEEKNKSHSPNGIHKTVTFGENSTKEIVPVKNIGKDLNDKHCFGISCNEGQDRVEMESIQSYDLIEPKLVAPKPPPVYFQSTSVNDIDGKKSENKKSTIIKITECPTEKLQDPGKLNFKTQKDACKISENELKLSLTKSNLKNKIDTFANFSNGNLIKSVNEKSNNLVVSRYNNCHAKSPIISLNITENQISSVKKTLKSFEKKTNNTVMFKIPKIN